MFFYFQVQYNESLLSFILGEEIHLFHFPLHSWYIFSFIVHVFSHHIILQ